MPPFVCTVTEFLIHCGVIGMGSHFLGKRLAVGTCTCFLFVFAALFLSLTHLIPRFLAVPLT